jgi:uncharacterized protein (TIGR02996 family)
MSTEAALIAAIAADPDDDTARLVFADWREECRSLRAALNDAARAFAKRPPARRAERLAPG